MDESTYRILIPLLAGVITVVSSIVIKHVLFPDISLFISTSAGVIIGVVVATIVNEYRLGRERR